MPTYKLVNPKIVGSFDGTVDTKKPKEAAEQIWNSLTKYITKNVPNFLFTIEKQDGGQLYHFQVSETPDGKLAKYSITELEQKLSPSQTEEFKKEIEKANVSIDHMSGGKKRYKKYEDDSSSSSSDDDETYKKLASFVKPTLIPSQPIVYWWYSPYVYRPYRPPSVYIPTFRPPLIPYVEINLSSSWLG